MNFTAIGLMSGTSLDGLDICLATFNKEDSRWRYQILHAETVAYPPEWERKLRDATEISSTDLLALNAEYGFYLGEQADRFIKKYSVQGLDLIASHGHTVFHQPERKFTLQIGDGRAIKISTGIPTVYDFRSQDVLMGGNGAPLVPIGDQLLFSGYGACLNIGGFANISFSENNKRRAFDICPVNFVLNKFARQLGKNYDEDGQIAENGIINITILSALNQLAYYQLSPPKSLGSEWVEDHMNALLKNETTENIIATFTEHAAVQISNVIKNHRLRTVLVTGGGAYNKYLIKRIKALSDAEIIIPETGLIEFKEALIFAFMGVLKMKGEINILCSATGSPANHSAGILV